MRRSVRPNSAWGSIEKTHPSLSIDEMMNPYQQQEVLFVENEFENFSIPALVTESGQNVLAGVPQMALEWIQYSAKRDLGKFSNILLRISYNLYGITHKKQGGFLL